MDKTLYEQDYYLWLEKTVNLLEDRRFSELDIENLVEEIKAMSQQAREKLEGLLTQLLIHLLKLIYWKSERAYNENKWRSEVRNFRVDIKRILINRKTKKYNTNLLNHLNEVIEECYQDARNIFLDESRIDKNIVNPNSIGTIKQLLDEDWFPVFDE
jgi:hypothetical protein